MFLTVTEGMARALCPLPFQKAGNGGGCAVS